jgi:hypothetical protein
MKDGAIIRQGDVYFALKERADQKSDQEIIAYLEEITKFGDYYAKLLYTDAEPSLKVRERMRRLNRIEVTTTYPFLLNVYHDYVSQKISEAEFAEVLDILENFMIRRFVCSVPTNQLNKIFPPLYAQVTNDNSLINGVKEVLRTKNYPRDADFRERFISSKLYGSGHRLKLILERLETSFEHQEPVPFESLTIEHIMPQTLTEGWKQHLGENWETVHEVLLDTIGNLTLSGYNPELSNATFQRKQEILRNSHLELNKYFGMVLEWNEDAIRRRAELLANRALEVWKYFGSPQEEGNALTRGVTGSKPKAIIVLGERFAVSSWREVAQKTLETIAEVDVENFEQIANQFPHFVGRASKRFRAPRQLKNGAFMETNLNADAINKLCIQVVALVGLSSEDWRVEFV